MAISDIHTRPRARELDDLVTVIRGAVSRRADWRQTARLVAGHLPPPDMLADEQRIGDPDTHRSHLLHTEPDGTFSIVALVWRPGQVTPIHDHVTLCALGVIQGVESEEPFTLDEESGCLVAAGTNVSRAGDASGFAPPATSTA
jgi:3-mercaptopropionate dioxygenase